MSKQVEGLERKLTDPFFKYTEEELKNKELTLKTMKELYPDVPILYIDLEYLISKENDSVITPSNTLN